MMLLDYSPRKSICSRIASKQGFSSYIAVLTNLVFWKTNNAAPHHHFWLLDLQAEFLLGLCLDRLPINDILLENGCIGRIAGSGKQTVDVINHGRFCSKENLYNLRDKCWIHDAPFTSQRFAGFAGWLEPL